MKLKNLFLTSMFAVLISSAINGQTIYQMDAYNGSTITTCQGQLWDSRNWDRFWGDCLGADEYCTNENYVVTINTGDPALVVRLNFLFYNIETGFDGLTFYDGATTGAPVISTLDGFGATGETTAQSAFVVTSTQQYLTVQFTSDGLQNYQNSTFNGGFEALIGCEMQDCGPTTPAADDECGTATVMCDLDGYCGSTSGWYTAGAESATLGSNYLGDFCGSIENNSWIEFTAGATSASFTITSSGCDDPNSGIQAMIFDSDCSTFNAVSNCINQSTAPGSDVLSANGLTVGDSYYIMIDGFAGNACDYTITANTGVQVVDITSSAGSNVCPGQCTDLTVNAAGATSYNWTSNPAGASGSTATINVCPTVTTTYTAEVTGICGGTQTASFTVDVVNPNVDFHGLDGSFNAIPVPATVECDDPAFYLEADDSVTAGSYITPALHFIFTSDGWATSDPSSVNIYSGGPPASGTLIYSQNPLDDNSVLTVYGEYLSPSTDYYIEICDGYGDGGVDYEVVDGNTNVTYGSGSIVSGSPCEVFGPFSPAGVANWSSTAPGVSWTSNDGGLLYFDPSIAGIGSYDFTYDWDNTLGCSGSATHTIDVVDTQSPTITCPGNITDFTDPGTCAANVVNPAPVYSDNCNNLTLTWALTGATTGSSPATGINVVGTQNFNLGTTTVTYTLTDGVNTVTCSYTVTVTDNIDPTAICQPLTVNLDASGNASVTPAQIDNGSSDNCGIVSYSVSPNAFTCADLGANTVTLTVEDAAGNTGSCTATVTVVDNIAPTALCQPFTVNLDASGNATIAGTDVNNSSTDNCGVVSYSVTPSAFTCADIGTNTVTLTVEDAAGNSDNCNATVTVVDNTPPTAICQPLTVNLDASGNATITPAQIDNGSSDNCGIVNYSLDVTTFGCTDVGTNTVTLTVEDAAGLSDNCTATVTVVDNTPPTAICQPLTVNLDASGNATITPAQINNGSSDNCGIVNYSLDVTTFGCADVGTNTVTLTVEDAAGNTDDCTATVTVVDNIAPTALCQPFTVNLDASGNATIAGTDVDNSSTDNCGIVSYSVTPNAFTCADIGTNTVTLTVEDAAGNSDNCNATVTLVDNTPPTAICQPLTVNLDASGNATITPAQIDNGSSDNCGIVNYSLDVTTFGCADVGTNTVTLTVEDAAGNTDDCSATVTVVENIAPTASCQPFTVNLDASGNATIVGTDVDGGSTDNCGIVSYSVTPNAFTCADIGTNTVTLTVEDAAGNTDNCTATVTVVDNIAPTALCQPFTVNLDASGNATIAGTDVDNSSTDNCGIVSYSVTPNAFTCADIGTNTVTLTVEDAAGNTDNCTATVTVVDNIAPTAICQPLTVNLDASGNATITPAQIDNGSSDNCGIVNYSLDVTTFGCADVGANTVTLTVEDAAGNSDNCTATVTVVDNIAPTASCQPFTVNLDAAGNATIVGTDVDGGSTDNCGIVSYSVTPNAFTCADIGTNTVTLTVEDAAGNTDNCTATVTVVDNIAPTALCQPFTVNLDASGNATITPAQIDNGSSDNCGIVNYSLDVNTFGCADVGTNTVTLTVEDAAGNTDNCTATVTVNDPNVPTASAGPDDTICEGDTYSLSGASGGSATTGSWSTSGDGTFVPGVADPNATYTPGTTDISNGSVTLTWTTDPSPCATDSESMILTINLSPTPTITGDTEYCAGSTAAISTGAFSTYSWSNGASTQNTTVTTADNPITVTVTDANGCPGTSAIYNVTENPNPQISITPTDPTVCNATDGSITVNSVSGSTSGDITWTGTASGSNNTIVLPNDITNLSAGNYNVTFTDVNGCPSSIESTVLTNPGAPIINIINDTSSCEIEYVVPDPTTYITGTNLTGNQAFYSAAGGNAVDEITPGTVITSAMSPMTIYVYDNSGTCDSEISFIVDVNDKPVATISPDPAVVCEGSSLNLNGNPSGGSGIYTIQDWSGDVSILSATNIQSPSTLVGATYGSYNITYTVTDDNGCTGTDDITVLINEMPVLSGDQEICEDETTTISSTGTPDPTTPWTSSDGSIATVDGSGNVLGVSGGTVDITFLDANGCSEIITIDVNTKPVITLTANDPTTCNGSDGSITVNGTGTGTVDWSGDATGTDGSATLPYDITNLLAGNYDVVFTDGVTGCASDQVSTSLNNPGAPIIDAINDTSSCEVDFVIPEPSTYITGANLTGSQAFYSATGGNAGDELTPGTVITSAMSPMTIYAFDNNGVCESETSFTVYVNENPIVSISPNPISVCTDESIQVNGNPSGGSGNYTTHDWTNSGAVYLADQTIQDPSFNSNTVGNYDLTYTVTDDNGCTATETIPVTVLQSTVIDTILSIVSCGDVTLPTISGGNLSGSEAIYDNTQANSGQIVTGPITTSGTFYAYDSGADCSNEMMFEVTINEVPQITSLLEDIEYCDYEVPQDVVITVSGQPDWNIEYTVDGVSQTATSSQNTVNLGNTPGIYNITLIEDNICSDTINEVFELIIKPSPPSPVVYENAEYCSHDEMDSMRAEGLGGTITWYMNQFQQMIGTGDNAMPGNVIGTTIYYITETVNGCESEPSEISINVLECDITLPTAITPDDDGLNDTWEIPNLDAAYPDNVVRVYNRWGSQIFEHDSSKKGPYNSNPWDGKTNGEILPVGSYYYVIDLNNEDKETKTGAISIILD